MQQGNMRTLVCHCDEVSAEVLDLLEGKAAWVNQNDHYDDYGSVCLYTREMIKNLGLLRKFKGGWDILVINYN